jgi:hypothetical protein
MSILQGSIPSEPRTLYFRLRNVDFHTKRNEIAARAVREGDWKLYFRGNKTPQLFNLRDDIAEANDVAFEHPEIAARLAKKLADWEREVTPPGELFTDETTRRK